MKRPRHSELTPDQRRRANVRSQLHVALKRGLVQRAPCAICGGQAEAHHPEYSRPLYVVWLCVVHHKAVHDGTLPCPPATEHFRPFKRTYKPRGQAATSEKLCSKCRSRPSRANGRWCPQCHADYQRVRRAELRKEIVAAGLARRRSRNDVQ